MVPKQLEMDLMVRQIYTSIESQPHLANTLFVLCGDHGMNDAGGHGASSAGETSPALVFMSPKMKKITEFMDRKSPVKEKDVGGFEYHRKISQADIVPTLAGLLGFPIPRNNLGVFIDEFLHFWDEGMSSFPLLSGSPDVLRFEFVGLIADTLCGRYRSHPPPAPKRKTGQEDCRENVPEGTLWRRSARNGLC
jgi:hypothetical protein